MLDWSVATGRPEWVAINDRCGPVRWNACRRLRRRQVAAGGWGRLRPPAMGTIA